MYRKTLNILVKFLNNRIIELFGLCLVIFSFFLLLSIITYSASDPNFLYTPDDIAVENLMGIKGSFASDFFLQSIGLISFLFIINLLIWGMHLIRKKIIKSFLSKVFFTIIYMLLGTSFLAIYNDNSFWLVDNGNSGFLGKIIFDKIYSLYEIENNIYIILTLFLTTILFFSLSVGWRIKEYIKIIRFPFSLIKKLKSKKNNEIEKTDINIVSQSISDDEIKNNQPNLPFKNIKEKMASNNQYKLPPLNYLEKNLNAKSDKSKENILASKNSEFLEKILLDFGVEGKIKRISCGPVVTLHEFEPASGIKVSKIVNLADDIARNTSSISTRVATIPGQSTIGIEIPNLKRENVFLNEIIIDDKFSKKEIKLPIALGKSISGIPIVGDLSAMPHLLIAGTTGSGKSVCINTIILSLLYKYTPEKCNLILIDPKMLELSTYEGIPHLLCPVITEAKKATSALGWAVKEMENRYKLMTNVGVKNIDGYNSKHKKHMPYIVVIVDEMSDLMLIAGKEIENYIQRLSQMARAAGIHIIMATQRPSVDVITGTIKANFPTRISFQVSSKIDSRTILGEQGAEQLLGKGDMLFMSSANRIIRIHGPYVSESEIEKINSYLRSQGEPDYVEEITAIKDSEIEDSENNNDEKDELYHKAVEIIKIEGKASTSFLQRKLQIGYNRAARIMETMEKEGIVGQANHVGKREIL
jgi:S-DNA-T family DNA segregation ATPase FtsK/SpoIIIE